MSLRILRGRARFVISSVVQSLCLHYRINSAHGFTPNIWWLKQGLIPDLLASTYCTTICSCFTCKWGPAGGAECARMRVHSHPIHGHSRAAEGPRLARVPRREVPWLLEHAGPAGRALLTSKAPRFSLTIRTHRALLRGGACDLAVRTLTATLCRCLTVSSK